MPLVGVKVQVVGDIALAGLELLFDHRMSSIADLQCMPIVQYRTAVAERAGVQGECTQHIQSGYHLGTLLNAADPDHHFLHERCIDLVLQGEHALLGTEYALFQAFEFVGDIPLGAHERLFAHPLVRHLVLVGVAHLQVVTEHIVVAHLQGSDARAFSFAALHFEQELLRVGGHVAQFVQLGVHTRAHDTSFGQGCGCLGLQGGFDGCRQVHGRHQFRSQGGQGPLLLAQEGANAVGCAGGRAQLQ